MQICGAGLGEIISITRHSLFSTIVPKKGYSTTVLQLYWQYIARVTINKYSRNGNMLDNLWRALLLACLSVSGIRFRKSVTSPIRLSFVVIVAYHCEGTHKKGQQISQTKKCQCVLRAEDLGRNNCYLRRKKIFAKKRC